MGLPINEPFSVKKGLNTSAKSIGPGQPAQADLDRNFIVRQVNFCISIGPYYPIIHLAVKTEIRMSKVKRYMAKSNR